MLYTRLLLWEAAGEEVHENLTIKEHPGVAVAVMPTKGRLANCHCTVEKKGDSKR